MRRNRAWNFDAAEVRRGLESMLAIRVTVVGEAIVDEYAYCDSVGKSGKEPMLVTRFLHCEEQAGGALAIANHMAEFCGEVRLLTALGEFDRRETFVRASLHPNIRPTFITKPASPTIVKRRYLDSYSKAKMLGVYRMETSALSEAAADAFSEGLRRTTSECDLVVVADYGHGLIHRRQVEELTGLATFLALNTQLNADNGGYNTLSKYPRADYACLHEGELRLDARDAHGDLVMLLRRARERIRGQAVMATRGASGTLLHTKEGEYECPAFAKSVVERVGAGDAVLALSSAAVCAGLQPDAVNVLANLAGAQAVSYMGNHASIRKEALLTQLDDLMRTRSECG